MPRKRVNLRLAESAASDLEEIHAWYAEQGAPDVGERLVSDVLQSTENLERHPEMGRVVPEFGEPSMRELIRPPFRIIYIYYRGVDKLGILRIWRSERRLQLPEIPEP